MQTPTPTTELEAVNVMLSLLGESPVNTLQAPYGADVALARQLLYEQSKKVQAEGWAFNKERDYTLTRETDTTIKLASNVLSVDADTDSAVDVVFRAGKLYDRKNHKFTFDHDLKVEIIWMFPFDELPEAARHYIAILAARKLQARFLGSEQQEAFSQTDEVMARVRLMHEEADTADHNILNSPDQAYIARRWQFRRYR